MTADTERLTLQQFVARHKITARVKWADSNPNNADWRDANHYKVTLRHKGRQLTTPFSQGYGIKTEPDAENVLNSLALDSSGFENARSFEEWASEYGYDTDSRAAERTYRVCERQARKLAAFLGSDLYHALLWETESL